MEISDIVNVTIDRNTVFPTRLGFGTPMLIDENTVQGAPVITVKSLQDMIDQGFTTEDLAYLHVKAIFSQSPRVESVKIYKRGAGQTIAQAVVDLAQRDNDWYFLLLTTHTDQDILEASAYIETVPKMFFATSNDGNILGQPVGETTSIAGQLNALNYDRTVLVYAEGTPLGLTTASAWVGAVAPKDPGSVTWKFKTLNGVPVVSNLIPTTEANVLGKNVNLYLNVAGISITVEGTTISGEFIDIIRGTDQLQRRIQEAVYALLANEDKVPYTNKGGDAIRANVQGPIDQAVEDGLLAGGDEKPVVIVPDVLNIDPALRSLRQFGPVTFTGRYAGAVHKVTIEGNITV